MYNLFKQILPALKTKFFGNYTVITVPTDPLKIHCQTLYLVDNLNDLQIIDLEYSLNIMDEISWEINDGC